MNQQIQHGWVLNSEGPLRPRTQQDFVSDVVGLAYINLHHECELRCSNDFRDKHGVLKLVVGTALPYTIYRVTLYLWVLLCLC